MRKLYELFILGELMDQVQHGYLLFSTLNKVIGPVRAISWGVLYPLIHHLEKEGYLEPVGNDAMEGGRKRKSYQITSLGKNQFYSLMNEPIAYKTDYELHACVKISNFDQISPSMQMSILMQYNDFLNWKQAFIRQNFNEVHNNPNMPQQEVTQVESIIELRLKKNELTRVWIEEKIIELQKIEAEKQ